MNHVGERLGVGWRQDHWRSFISTRKKVNLGLLGLSLKEKGLFVRKLVDFYPKALDLIGRLRVFQLI